MICDRCHCDLKAKDGTRGGLGGSTPHRRGPWPERLTRLRRAAPDHNERQPRVKARLSNLRKVKNFPRTPTLKCSPQKWQRMGALGVSETASLRQGQGGRKAHQGHIAPTNPNQINSLSPIAVTLIT